MVFFFVTVFNQVVVNSHFILNFVVISEEFLKYE